MDAVLFFYIKLPVCIDIMGKICLNYVITIKRNIVPVFGTIGLAVRFTCVNVWDLVEMWM